MRKHPGTFALKRKHLSAVSVASDHWRATHPAAVPGWGAGQDPILARLVWLEWWIRWALQNCESPALHNH